MRLQGHGGMLAVEVMKRWGAEYLFTLSGGHIFPIYDGCVKLGGIEIVDTRHEQTAAFAAEGYSKLTRKPGFVALTAGPGVTNGISAITTAHFNGSPLVVLAGRAPQARWGEGSLQEFDHIPVVRSVTKAAATATSTAEIPKLLSFCVSEALTPHRGPAFVDFPLDVLFVPGEADLDESLILRGLSRATAGDSSSVVKALEGAERPVLVGGSDVYWDGAWEALRALVERARIPTFLNGMGRGCLPADHPLCFSRSRSLALKEADLVVVAGTPLDFRLNFGRFGGARVVHIADHPDMLASHVELVASAAGPLSEIFEEIAAGVRPCDRSEWIGRLQAEEESRREKDASEMASESKPIDARRVYGELRKRLERNAIVICDGGDFVSFAGRYIDVFEPGCWMDPGPYGCLGTGPGYGLAAKLVHPDRQVVILFGDGAFGFSGIDYDTLVRFDVPVVGILSNNGIWGLEKHPMRALYGYDVAADLQAECRYDLVVEALGGHGEFVTDPSQLGPAIDRAFEAGKPALVNVVTDPNQVYPRSSNLA
ncbi:MAG: acetolactate synthase [Acidimicrobiia bacterium]